MGITLRQIILAFSFLIWPLFYACEREELTPFDLDLRTELLSPDPSLVFTGDSVTFRFRMIPDDSLLFDDFRVNGIKPSRSGNDYVVTLNLLPLRPRVKVSVTVALDGQTRLADTIRILAMGLSGLTKSGELETARSGHVTAVRNPSTLITSGGVSAFFDSPLNSYEEFDLSTKTSRLVPDFQLQTPRTGHAMVVSPSGTVVVAGGQTLFNPQGSTGELNTEIVKNSLISIHPPSGLTGDFAWSSHGDTLAVHGGRDQKLFRIFTFSGDSLVQRLSRQTSFDFYNHSLTFLPGYPGFFFLESGFFSYGYPLQTSYLVRESNGDFFFSDLLFQEIRLDHTVSALPGNFLLIAGGYQPGEGSDVVFSSIEIADLESGRTYFLPVTLNNSRFAHSAVAIEQSVYFTGGFNSNRQALRTIEYLKLDY